MATKRIFEATPYAEVFLMVRDARIDTIRGLAMVTIIINHFSALTASLGMTGPQIPTATTVSLSSAAEIFVILSGYMVGLVYVKKTNATKLLVTRAAKLYAWNLLLFIAAALSTFFTNHPFNEAVRFTPLTTVPVQAVAYFSLMMYGPFLIDILHLYVMFLLASPAAVWLTRRSPLLLVSISMALYLSFQVCVRIYPDLAGSPNPLESGYWRFHPLAWQLLYFVAMAGGSAKMHEKVFTVLEERRWIFWALVITFSITGAMKVVLNIPYISFTDKGTLGPLRVLHSILVVLLYAGIVTMMRNNLHWFFLKSAAMIGRHSLNAFLFSTVATFISLFIWQRFALGWSGYIAITAALIVATWGAAKYWDRRKFATALGSGPLSGVPVRARM